MAITSGRLFGRDPTEKVSRARARRAGTGELRNVFFGVIECGFVVRGSINYCFVVQKQMLIGLLQWKRSCASEYCYSVVWKGQEKQLIGFGHDW